jgi:hypothetical protein
LSFFVLITLITFISLALYGSDYYVSRLAERHNHIKYEQLKPSGTVGHGLGIAGSFFILTGVFEYMARKRIRKLYRLGLLKHWLEFHIFLCVLGPILILYHTTFKFGGIVAVSFWSMVVVVISGIIGRFIYLQIPRTIQGRQLSLNELMELEGNIITELNNEHNSGNEIISKINEALKINKLPDTQNLLIRIIRRLIFERNILKRIKKDLRKAEISGSDYRKIVRLLKTKIKLNRRISWLSTMQKLFGYWHVLHLPFALIMLIIMFTHIIVVVLFGYTWIF